MKTVETWFLWLMIYSIIGWVYESTICSISQRKLINRGFLNGPYCPIYGTGAVLVLLDTYWAMAYSISSRCVGLVENSKTLSF